MILPLTRAVVIGGSAGALNALSKLLPALPKDYALPVLVVVHLPPDKKSVLAEVLQPKCSITIREAEDKEPLAPGTVYIAPPDYHLLVEADRTLALSYDEPECFSRPSINVLFESAADVFGPGLVGVILSGANDDGARGAAKVIEEGGAILVQSPTGAYASAMPLAASEKCPTARTLDVEHIAVFLKEEGLKP